MIDIYCERLAPGLYAEPINASTNVAFFIVAWAIWALARRLQADDTPIRGLVALTIVIGAGSALFHTFATGWARILDEVPILLFQLNYLWVYQRRNMKIGPATSAMAIIGYLVIALLARQFPHLLNGSMVYAPALIVMLAMGLYHWIQKQPGRALLLAATGVFLISVIFRSLDEALCPYVPVGTHFLWHILNGLVLYLSLRALILKRTGKLTLV